MADESIDEVIRQVSEGDQLASGLQQTANIANQMFKQLQAGGMTRREAFTMTQTWLVTLIAAVNDKR